MGTLYKIYSKFLGSSVSSKMIKLIFTIPYMIYFRIFPQQCGLVVPLPMVIVGRSEEGLQRRRQRSSLDCQNCHRNSRQDTAAIARITARAARSNTSSEAEAATALIRRRDLPGNFTEEPLRPLWPSLEPAATAYDYILPLSAVIAATTALACRREEGLQHNVMFDEFFI